MRTVAIIVGAILAFVLYVGYGIPLLSSETRTTESRIKITRTVGFSMKATYELNKQSGDITITRSRFLPYFGIYESAEFNSACACIARVYKNDDYADYSVYRNDKTEHSAERLKYGDQIYADVVRALSKPIAYTNAR